MLVAPPSTTKHEVEIPYFHILPYTSISLLGGYDMPKLGMAVSNFLMDL